MSDNPIGVETVLYDDGDLGALITVCSDDGTEIEVDCDYNEVRRLAARLDVIASKIALHRAKWLITSNHGTEHLARKETRQLACGTKPPQYSEWSFSPLQGSPERLRNICKRCLAIYTKAEA